MTIQLQNLPYAENALAPVISEKTVEFHYHKHHAGYVQKTNELIYNTDLENKSLEEIILTTANNSTYQTLFNNAAQAWNHQFYWQSLKPYAETSVVPEKLKMLIERDFGTVEALKNQLQAKGLAQFGSGWVWLVTENDKLSVLSSSNAQTPLTNKAQKPLLTIDVWEHAYYLDCQNNRAAYLQNVINHLLNWEFAAQNLTGE